MVVKKISTLLMRQIMCEIKSILKIDKMSPSEQSIYALIFNYIFAVIIMYFNTLMMSHLLLSVWFYKLCLV